MPVALRGAGFVEARGFAEPENVLHGDDGDFGVGFEGGVDKRPMRCFPVCPKVAAEVVAGVFACRVIPADAGVVVVRSRVGDGVGADVMRKIEVGSVPAERKLQNRHAGEPGVGEELAHAVVHVAEVFGNEANVAEIFLNTFEKRQSGTESPATCFRRGRIGGNAPVIVKAAEVVEADDVVKLEIGTEAAHPPVVIGFGERVPIVKRVAPKLSVGGEIIGRDSGDGGRRAGFIELEDFRILPNVRAVESDENRSVSDDFYAVFEGVFSESFPLREEEELGDFEHFDIGANARREREFFRGAEISRLGGPFIPGLAFVEIF